MTKAKNQSGISEERDLNALHNGAQYLVIGVLRIWTLLIWPIRQFARAILWAINKFMWPQEKTGRPNNYALIIWFVLNLVLSIYCFDYLQDAAYLSLTLSFGALHFLFICTALLVIAEELDVWNGYVRINASNNVDHRFFRRGKAIKSLPLILISVLFYIVFIAMALRGVHANFKIFSVEYNPVTPLWRYMVTVASQAPVLRSAIGEFDGLVLAEFSGLGGTAIQIAINAASISVLIGTITSYFRQKSEIRKLLDAINSDSGDRDLLNKRASHAPDEIKPHLINFALHAPKPRTRHRAMSVAKYKNILTFPRTILHHLHDENSPENKIHAVKISTDIIDNNVELDEKLLRSTQSKVDHQLQEQTKEHDEDVRKLLTELKANLTSRIQHLVSRRVL